MSPRVILVVEDEPHMQRLLQFTLARTGERIEAVASGEEALARATVSPVDLLVVDLRLPGLDGFATVAAIRRLPACAHVPVIMMTSRGDTDIRAQAGVAGIERFMTKPFSPVALVREASALLAR